MSACVGIAMAIAIAIKKFFLGIMYWNKWFFQESRGCMGIAFAVCLESKHTLRRMQQLILHQRAEFSQKRFS